MDVWYEHTLYPFHGQPPKLVADLTGLEGFRSVYGYPTPVKTWIDDRGAVIGLGRSGLDVYSDKLLLDFDDTPDSASKFVADLDALGIEYGLYTTGRRSVHVEVTLEPMLGPTVPQSQKRWLNEWASAREAEIDDSIYTHTGLYRLPGTAHHKNGRPKQFLGTYGAKPLFIDPELVQAQSQTEFDTCESLMRCVLKYQDKGGRHRHAWIIVSKCAELGMDRATAADHLQFWNSRHCRPALPAGDLDATLWRVFGNGA